MLKTIKLTNFKNLNLSLDLEEKNNLIVASNGTGKTNFLEAIYILSNGFSFKSYPEENLINFSKVSEFAKLNAILELEEIEVIISNLKGETKKILKVNGVEKSASKFSIFDSIFFAPNTVDLVSGTPAVRRKDVDDFLSELDSKYKQHIATYKKILFNRNKLLIMMREGKGSLDLLDFWNDKLIESGSYIIEKRLGLFSEVENDVKNLAKSIFHEDLSQFAIGYVQSFPFSGKESFKNHIMDKLDDEIRRGISLIGPHRDEIEFQMGGKNLKYIGSRGQQRIASLIYKIALYKLLENTKNRKGLLLLDDVMSELDEKHREKIEELLESDFFGQVIITSCDPNDFTKKFLEGNRELTIS